MGPRRAADIAYAITACERAMLSNYLRICIVQAGRENRVHDERAWRLTVSLRSLRSHRAHYLDEWRGLERGRGGR